MARRRSRRKSRRSNPAEQAALYAINPGRRRHRRRNKNPGHRRHRRRGRRGNPGGIRGMAAGLLGRLTPNMGEAGTALAFVGAEMASNTVIEKWFKPTPEAPDKPNTLLAKLAAIFAGVLGARALGMLLRMVPVAQLRALAPHVTQGAWAAGVLRGYKTILIPAIPAGKVKDFLTEHGLRGHYPQPARGATVDGLTGQAYELDGTKCTPRGLSGGGDDMDDGIDGTYDDEEAVEGDGIN